MHRSSMCTSKTMAVVKKDLHPTRQIVVSTLYAGELNQLGCLLCQDRSAPYSPISFGTHSNDRSKLLFRSMLYNGDLIFACRSHQQVLVSMLSQMNNYAGLTVKVLNRDEDDFPSGYHYHMKKDWMRQFVDGKKDPYVFVSIITNYLCD